MNSENFTREQKFDYLYNKSLSVKEESARINRDNLAKLLQHSLEDIEKGNVKTFSSDDIIERLSKDLDNEKEKINTRRLNWLKTLAETDKPLFSIDFIEYIFKNQSESSEPGYYQYWAFIENIFNLYQSLSRKEFDFDLNVVAMIRHQENPYSSEQYLPLIELKTDSVAIKFTISDPVSDNYLVLIDNLSDTVFSNVPWEEDIFSESYIETLMASLPEALSKRYETSNKEDKSFYLTLNGENNLFALICDYSFS